MFESRKRLAQVISVSLLTLKPGPLECPRVRGVRRRDRRAPWAVAGTYSSAYSWRRPPPSGASKPTTYGGPGLRATSNRRFVGDSHYSFLHGSGGCEARLFLEAFRMPASVHALTPVTGRRPKTLNDAADFRKIPDGPPSTPIPDLYARRRLLGYVKAV